MKKFIKYEQQVVEIEWSTRQELIDKINKLPIAEDMNIQIKPIIHKSTTKKNCSQVTYWQKLDIPSSTSY